MEKMNKNTPPKVNSNPKYQGIGSNSSPKKNSSPEKQEAFFPLSSPEIEKNIKKVIELNGKENILGQLIYNNKKTDIISFSPLNKNPKAPIVVFFPACDSLVDPNMIKRRMLFQSHNFRVITFSIGDILKNETKPIDGYSDICKQLLNFVKEIVKKIDLEKNEIKTENSDIPFYLYGYKIGGFPAINHGNQEFQNKEKDHKFSWLYRKNIPFESVIIEPGTPEFIKNNTYYNPFVFDKEFLEKGTKDSLTNRPAVIYLDMDKQEECKKILSDLNPQEIKDDKKIEKDKNKNEKEVEILKKFNNLKIQEITQKKK